MSDFVKIAYPFRNLAAMAGGGMDDAFLRLNVPRTLELGEEQLRKALQRIGSTEHPDAGSVGDEFEQALAAFALLSSPSRRLRHWLELTGSNPEPRGAVEQSLMELFGRVSEVGLRAEAVAKRREASQSALGLALLEAETQLVREEVEALIAVIDQAIHECCELFPGFENGVRLEEAPQVMRSLGFLEKWRNGTRSLYARLI